MKLTLKIVFALAVIMAAGVVYAEIPDVSKWSCTRDVPNSLPDYGIEFMDCNSNGLPSVYMKVSDKPIYIHEHRKEAGNVVYYNALKTSEEALWVEIVNKKDLIIIGKLIENKEIEVSIVDDNGAVIAKRIIPLLKK